jgi:hypothetical protein
MLAWKWYWLSGISGGEGELVGDFSGILSLDFPALYCLVEFGPSFDYLSPLIEVLLLIKSDLELKRLGLP